ncbi:flagellar assembly protein FliW [Paenibacillus xerothermodurans]|uniref:Flagellar assembly factor FliW n=1 Tax=Paenibacillus xerothermodurans TaxID=1977292 RepID=A0A2W1NN89_PAEXE|nr:flagellar assembly protein FliW [Paenibacillus xerothermodurans]PZE19286.1 flagellar assembly protein FliW [Paenibacillus xerothermodurans]
MIKLNTTSLGEIEVAEDQIIAFPEGIPGFGEYRSFTILPIEPGLPFAYLQSVDEERIHFVVVNPFVVFSAYDIEIDQETQTDLQISDPTEVEVWCILAIKDTLEAATVNLLAPIIINSKQRIGKQVILHDSSYAARHLLSELIQQSAAEDKERVRCWCYREN